MKKKILSLLTAVMVLVPTLTGCSFGHFVESVFHTEEKTEEEPVISDGYIYGETSTIGIDSRRKDYLEQLTENTYYVIHDEVWYPLSHYYTSFKTDKDSPEKADSSRIICLDEEHDANIPTLYSTDKLVFYSTTNLLDYTTFERFKDLGWTFPIMSYNTITDGRLYLFFDKEAKPEDYTIMPGCSLYDVYNKDLSVSLYIDKIGGVSVDSTMLNDSGLFDASYLQKGKDLDFECYRGTIFEHYTVSVNTHAFSGYEVYAQPTFKALQSNAYEIPVPEYLPSGYYNINNAGLIRYVKEELPVDEAGNTIARYAENYDFNVQLLFPIQDERNKEYDTPYMYSELEDLNEYGKYKQAMEGTFGYIEEQTAIDEAIEENLQEFFKDSVYKIYYFEFPKGKECKITITSSTGEKTGDITLTLDSGRSKDLPYDMFDDNYSVSITGNGEIGELYISGLFDDYTIQIVNAVQTTNPAEAVTPVEPEPEPETESIETEE